MEPFFSMTAIHFRFLIFILKRNVKNKVNSLSLIIKRSKRH